MHTAIDRTSHTAALSLGSSGMLSHFSATFDLNLLPVICRYVDGMNRAGCRKVLIVSKTLLHAPLGSLVSKGT